MIHGLDDKLCADIDERMTADKTDDVPEKYNYDCNMDKISDESFPQLEKRLNLAKTDPEWQAASEYFKLVLYILKE